MPPVLYARPPLDEREERQVRTPARSAHAPADWVWHARMLVRSWEGWGTCALAPALGGHRQTVRRRCANAGTPSLSAAWRGWAARRAGAARHGAPRLSGACCSPW